MKIWLLVILFVLLPPAQAQAFVVPERMLIEPSAYKADLGDLVDYLSSLASDQPSALYRTSAYWAAVQDVSRATDIDYTTVECPAFRCFVVSAEQWSEGRPLRVVTFDWLVTVDEQRTVVDARLIGHLNFSNLQSTPPLLNDSFVFQMDFPQKFNQTASLCVYYEHGFNNAFDDALLDDEDKDWFAYLVKIEASGALRHHRVSSYRVCDNYYTYYMGFDVIIQLIQNPAERTRFSHIDYLEGLFILEPVSLSNVVHYNNIGYYLSEAGFHEAAVYVLSEVLTAFPNRTVAYINLGDAYWGLDQQEEARSAYQNYIRLMRESNREQRIPQRVFERVADRPYTLDSVQP